MSQVSAIPRISLTWLLVAQVLVIIPHLSHLPLWIIGLWLGSAAWRVQIFRMRARYPNAWAKGGLMLAAALGVFLSRGSLIGLDAGVVLLVFFLFKYFGGDPAEVLGGINATQAQIDAIRQQLGLDQPVWVQLWIFVKQVVTFDWGKSWATNEAVSNLFATRLPATLTVMVPILICDVLLALPIAMWVAYRRGSLTDRALMVVTTVALSISFLVYIIVGQYFFGFQLGWFPVQGWGDNLWTNLVTYVPLPALLARLQSGAA
jgi:ABC-type dipeptide/oligopeptide/nickel transport system permease component